MYISHNDFHDEIMLRYAHFITVLCPIHLPYHSQRGPNPHASSIPLVGTREHLPSPVLMTQNGIELDVFPDLSLYSGINTHDKHENLSRLERTYRKPT